MTQQNQEYRFNYSKEPLAKYLLQNAMLEREDLEYIRTLNPAETYKIIESKNNRQVKDISNDMLNQLLDEKNPTKDIKVTEVDGAQLREATLFTSAYVLRKELKKEIQDTKDRGEDASKLEKKLNALNTEIDKDLLLTDIYKSIPKEGNTEEDRIYKTMRKMIDLYNGRDLVENADPEKLAALEILQKRTGNAVAPASATGPKSSAPKPPANNVKPPAGKKTSMMPLGQDLMQLLASEIEGMGIQATDPAEKALALPVEKGNLAIAGKKNMGNMI